MANLHYEARHLRDNDNSQIDAVGRTIELILYLLWPPQSAAHLTLLAGELKDSICRYPFKRCVIMDLTSFQLMVGVLAAEKGSSTRKWFMDKLFMAMQCMQLRGWQRPFDLLESRLVSEVGLIDQFRGICQELQHR